MSTDDARALRDYIPSLSHIYAPRMGAPQRCAAYRRFRQPNGIEIIVLPRSAAPACRAAGVTLNIAQAQFAPAADALLSRDALIPDFLYDDQRAIVAHIRSLWTRESDGRALKYGSAFLDLRAGYGKTFVAAGIIALFGVMAKPSGARALYIVPTCELARQTCADLRAAFAAEDDERIVYADSGASFRAATCADAPARVCVVVINTILSVFAGSDSDDARVEGISRAFTLTIFDEAHTYCSPIRAKIFWIAQTRFMFGMTATVGERRDGFDFMLAHHLCPMIDAARIDGFSYSARGGDCATEFRCCVRKVRYFARDEYARNLRHESTDVVFAHYMYDQFARDEARTRVIVDETRALLNAGRNIFIFAEERAHVEAIARALDDARVASANDRECEDIAPARYVIFYSGVSDEERRVALCGGARVIIATFGYSGTGISIVRMDAMILASPRYSGMKQIVGRILRRGSDAQIERVIVDIVDQKTCLARQFRLRRNAYAFYGARFERVDIYAP